MDTLTRHWMNERNAPEVLRWEGGVVETVLDRIHAQVRVWFWLVMTWFVCRVLDNKWGWWD